MENRFKWGFFTIYRLVALDLDDTLLDKNLCVSEENRVAIRLAQEAGVHVTLATGRMYRSALPFARELDIEEPLITYQGALVKHAASGEVIYHRPVPLDLAVDVLKRIGRYGYHVNIYLDDELYVAEHNEESRRYSALSRVPVQAVGDLLEFLNREKKDPTKVLVVSREELLDELARELEPVYRGKLHITKSKPHFLEFSHPEATKGHALRAVADYYGISRQEILAVGDSYNDLEMIEFAGLGAVVGNAREEIRMRADYVAPPSDEGGVAEVIRRFVLAARR